MTLFMKVKVQVYLDSSDIQHEKLALRLVEPNIPGFSVPQVTGPGKRPSAAEDDTDTDHVTKKKKI